MASLAYKAASTETVPAFGCGELLSWLRAERLRVGGCVELRACWKSQELWTRFGLDYHQSYLHQVLELVSKELNHLAAILHVYAGGLYFMK